MNNGAHLSLAALLLATVSVAAQAQSQTFSVTKTSIGGDGGTDYITAEPGTGRVFVSRQTHFMVVDGATGRSLGDIPNTPGNHGAALAPKSNHGFITDGGDSTVTMFDLKSLQTIKKIPVVVGGLDGIMYDASLDRIILTNHSKPAGTLVALDPNSGEITGTVSLSNDSPEGAVGDGKGRLYVNLEGSNAIEVIDANTMKIITDWPIPDCIRPTGIAYDSASNRIFSGCSKKSIVVDAATGSVVATVANGQGVDALGWDPQERLLYIPAGRDGNVTVVHQDDPNHYTVIATVATQSGAKTLSVDTATHVAYLFATEYGPAPAGDTSSDSAAGGTAAGQGQPGGAPPGPGPMRARGPLIGAWLLAIHHP
jgi:DNA-binding beta-propeller fold protein YncE